MQEEKKATTPKKQSTAKRRRKRGARRAAPPARSTPAAAETASPAEPAAEENEAAAAPAPAPETAAPSAPETPEAPQTAEVSPQTPEMAEAEAPAQTQAVPADAEPSEPETPAEPDEATPADEAAAGTGTEETTEAPAAEPGNPEDKAEEKPAEEGQPAEETPQEEAKPAADAGDAEPSEPETPAEPDKATPADETVAAASAEETAEAPAAAKTSEAERPAEPEEEKPAEEGQPGEETPQEEAEAAGDAEPSEPETPAEPDKATPADETVAAASAEEMAETSAHTEAAELPKSEEQRVSDITRTVQLSIEQITAHLDAAPAEDAGAADPQNQAAAEEEASPTLADHLLGGLGGIARWLLLVLIFVLVIAVAGVVWLYRSATPDMLPQIRVTFAGQEVAPSSYQWKVPVVGKAIRRTYAETLSSAPATLAQPVEQTSPDFTVSPDSYRSELTVTDSEDAVVFEGDVETFANFQFTENGEYTAELTLYSDESPVAGDAAVIGSETWQLSFKVEVRPTVHLFATSVQQGGVAAVTVGDTVDGKPPQISTTLKNAGFGKSGSNWVCYLPIPWDQAPGKQSLTVTVGGYSETLEFEVSASKWDYKDYSSNYSLVSPYVSETDLPAELNTVLSKSETQVAWANSNFVQPLLNTLDVELYYGTTEYVGRTRSQRNSNPGTGGRTATNMVLSTLWGELLIAPANGTVVLAKDLGEGFGNTLVIDHGAGVKSIFYQLQQLNVKTGDQLKQGQSIATCGSALVAEMRIGTVPIDPRPVWRAQCDALKHY